MIIGMCDLVIFHYYRSPTFKTINHAAKVGIKSCRDVRECINFVHIELFHFHGYGFKTAILLNRFQCINYYRRCQNAYFRLRL